MSFYPLTDEKVISFCRGILGGITEDEVSDANILFQWELEKELHVNKDGTPNEPVALYYLIIDLVQFYIIPYLIANGLVDGSAHSEKEGQVSVSETTGDLIGAWWAWLKAFEARPNIPDLGGSRAGVIIGGVSNEEYNRVARDADSRNGRVALGDTTQTLIRCGRNNFVLCPVNGMYRC